MVGYLTPDDAINLDQLLVLLTGRVKGFDEMLPRLHYQQYFNGHSILVASLRSKLRYNSQIPEVADGLTEFIKAYADEEDRVGTADFIQLYKDLFASDPVRYYEVIDKLWL
jgi:hypothetical protein